jgi:hypothetical protein
MTLPNAVGLETLLDLDGEVFCLDSGYWTKFEVKRVEPSVEIPHGIRYALTLHDRLNRRIVGFDNAHAVTPKRKRFGARRCAFDHRHQENRVDPYEFETPAQLLEDFWDAVEEATSSRGTR